MVSSPPLLLWICAVFLATVVALDASAPYEAIYFYYLYQVEFRVKGFDTQIAPGLSQYLADYADSHYHTPNENEPKGLARFGEFIWYITGNDPTSLGELERLFPPNNVDGAMIARERPKLLSEEPKQVDYKTAEKTPDKAGFEKAWKQWKTRYDQMYIDAGQKKLAMNPRDPDFIGYAPRTDPAAESRYNTAKPGKIKFQLDHISSSGSGNKGMVLDTTEASNEYIKVFNAVGDRIRGLRKLEGFRSEENSQSLTRANDALRTVINLRTRDSKTTALDKRITDKLRDLKIGPLPLPSQPKSATEGSQEGGGSSSSRDSGSRDEDYVRVWRYDSVNHRSSLKVDMAALGRWFKKPGVGVARDPAESDDEWRQRDAKAKADVLDIADSHARDEKTILHDNLITALRAQSDTVAELRSICRA